MERESEVVEEPESLWAVVRRDFGDAAGLRLLGVIAMLGWMAFQWGWGNDILLPPIVARTFDAIDNDTTWTSGLGASLAATSAGSMFWAITQTIDGVIVVSGLRLLPGITRRISEFLQRAGWVKPFDEISFGTRVLIAYASGASMLCLVDVFATGEPGLGSRKRMLAHAVGLSAGGVAFTVGIITAATTVGKRVPATTAAADTLVRYASNPLTWVAFYGSLVGLSWLWSRFFGADAVAEQADQTDHVDEADLS